MNLRSATPVRLPPENPHGLVNLLDMLRYYAGTVTTMMLQLGTLWIVLSEGQEPRVAPRDLLTQIRQECERLGWTSICAQIDGILRQIDIGIDPLTFKALVDVLICALQNELCTSRFFVISSEGATVFYSPHPFGPEVARSFHSVTFDATEAVKCLTLDRWTAAVFHLMRVLESGLSSLAAKFSVPSNHANWQNIIDGIEKAIRNIANDKNKPPDWKEQQEFYSQAASNFQFFKDAWRNYTAHARGKYTEEEARIIMDNVKAFMQKLSTRLHE